MPIRKGGIMDNENIVKTLSNHESRLENLEEYQEKQNGLISDINTKLDRLIWGIGAGMFAIILMLIKLLVG